MAVLGFIVALICIGIAALLALAVYRQRDELAVEKKLVGLLSPERAAAKAASHDEDQDNTIERWLPAWLRRRLFQAGIDVEPINAGVAGFFGLAVMVGLISGFGIAITVMIAITLVLVALAIIDYRARKRMTVVGNSMLGYFDRVRQLLVVGNSLPVALNRATASSPPVLAEVFTPTMRRIANGAGVGESMSQLAEELEVYEIRLFATAIETNLRFGGSITQIIANLIENIRRRSAVEREVRVNTAQIRSSAWVLALLPMLVGSLVMIDNDGYIGWFLHDPTGRMLLIYCVVSQIIGGILMRTVVKTTY